MKTTEQTKTPKPQATAPAIRASLEEPTLWGSPLDPRLARL